MADQHITNVDSLPEDEDDAVHLATEGIPDRAPEPDPDAFAPDVEANDPEDDAA